MFKLIKKLINFEGFLNFMENSINIRWQIGKLENNHKNLLSEKFNLALKGDDNIVS